MKTKSARSLAELKGFEVKRRGELRLIQVFQTEVFPEFLKGNSKEEVWQIVGAMANCWLDVIESRGRTMTNDEARSIPTHVDHLSPSESWRPLR